MFIFALIPILLLALPIIAIVMASRQASRLKALEREVAALKGQAIPATQAAPTAPAVPSAPVARAARDAATEIPVAPRRASEEDSSGRILGRIGIAAVLIGVAFFLKYAFDNDWIGPAGRVMIGVLIGLGFLGLGQYLRAKYLRYSDLLMGGGIAVLYLSIFSAQSFYGLIDPATSAALMFVVTLLSFAVSIYNATQTLAVVAVLGAFWTPFLIGFGADGMLPLFGYMTLVNAGVLGISFFKKWLRLNAISFAGTVILFLAWFAPYYSPDQLGPTLAFCILAFVIFLVSQAARGIAAGVKADQADYLLMGANAFGFACILYDLLNPLYHSVLGFAAVLVALAYIGFAFIVNRANPADTALNIFLPALSVVFLSVAVPMQFSGPWIAVGWFVESCALYGIASIIGNRGFQVMGLVVYILGLLDYTSWYYSRPFDPSYAPFFNAPFGLLMLAIAAAYVIAYIYRRYGSIAIEIQKRGIVAFVVIANILSIYALSIQVATYYDVAAYHISQDHAAAMANYSTYSNGYDIQSLAAQEERSYADRISSNGNISNTLVSILWTLYAAALTAFGFARRLASLRRFGLVLFIVTALKVLIDVWSIGELYRIISFIAFGAIALAASFGYVKYKDRLKGVLSLAALVGVSATALLGLSFAGAPAAHAAFSSADWPFVRTIQTPSTSGFVKASLPADISWTSRSDQPFADARIIDGQGNETPYILDRSLTSSGPTARARLIGLAAASDGSTRFIADLGQTGVVHTELDLDVGAQSIDFRRQVSVYASDSLLPIDDPRWSLVASNGYIFRITDHSSGSVLGKYSVAFPANASRYLKTVVAAGQEGPVSVDAVSARRDTQVSAAFHDSTYPATVLNDPTLKTTDVTIDLGAPGRLSDAATLGVGPADSNYIRRVVVHASDSLAASSWRYVGEGSISRISTSVFSGASNAVAYPEQRARYIRLSIVNDDNPPLSVWSSATVSSPILALIFQARPGASYALYYGNPSAAQPEYDMEGLSSYIDQGSLPLATVGAESPNPAYVPPAAPVVPYTESHAWALNAILVLLVLVIGSGVAWYLRAYMKAQKK